MKDDNDDSDHDEANNILAGQTLNFQTNQPQANATNGVGDSTILNPDNAANTTIMKVHSQFGNFQSANPNRKETVLEKGNKIHDPFVDSDSSDELMQGLGNSHNN